MRKTDKALEIVNLGAMVNFEKVGKIIKIRLDVSVMRVILTA